LSISEGLLGTPYYSAPEQVQTGHNVDARADQFALGTVLYECLAGQRPFEGDSIYDVLTAIMHGEPTPLCERVAGIPPELEQVVERALKKDPVARFSSVRGFGRALMPFASPRVRAIYAPEFAAAPVFALSSVAPPSPARTLWWGAAALALIGVSAVSWDSSDDSKPASSGQAGLVAQPLVRPETQAPLSPARQEQHVYGVQVQVQPKNASIKLDGKFVGTGHFETAFVMDGATHVLEASAPGHREALVFFRDAPPVRTITLEPLPAASERAQP
jgi:serine/threonine protein kinase